MTTSNHDEIRVRRSQRLSWLAIGFASVGAVASQLTPIWRSMMIVMVVVILLSLLSSAVGLFWMMKAHAGLLADQKIKTRLYTNSTLVELRGPASDPEEIKTFVHQDRDEQSLVDVVTGRYLCCGSEALQTATHAAHCPKNFR